MFLEQELIERLRNGESSEDIAKEFTDKLNDAIKKKDDLDESEIKYRAQLTDAQNLIDAFNTYVKNWNIDYKTNLKAQDIVDVFNKFKYISVASDTFKIKPKFDKWFDSYFSWFF